MKPDEAASISKMWYLRRFDIFSTFNRDELERVTRILNVREFERRDPVFLPAEDPQRIFFLIKGRVKVCRVDPDSGKELILYIIQPGELFGLLALSDEQPTETMAVALQRSLIGFMPHEDFQRLMQKNEFCMAVNKLVGSRLVRIENRLEEMLFQTVPVRLARLLLRLCDEFPGADKEGDLIDVRLTQQDVANLIGATREITSLTLNEFKREGWIDRRKGRMRVLERGPLQELARG